MRFQSAGEATFSGTTSGGVLTVIAWTHTATIHLIGDYTHAVFTAASDGHGGVLIVASAAPSANAFAAAMASMAAPAAAALPGLPVPPTGASLLAAPAGQLHH